MATIYCFTSTGNSLFTAKKLGEKIGGEVHPMNNGPMQIDDDVIGFVFPVYFWGLPRMVKRFVSEVQITNKNPYVFAVATSGGPNFGVLGWLKKLLKQNGIPLQYGVRLISVSNYLPQYLPKDSQELRQKIDHKITKIADAVNRRQSNWIFPLTLINKKAYKICPDEKSDQYFTVNTACIGCETCRKVCPAKNITMKSDKPNFLHQCEHCMACVHHCPVQAIDWNEKTQGKDRFRNSGISLEELISFNSKQGNT